MTDHFPYWPLKAFQYEKRTEFELRRLLSYITGESVREVNELTPLAEAAGNALRESWTIDFMLTARGWLLIDCATLENSWRPSDEDHTHWKEIMGG